MARPSYRTYGSPNYAPANHDFGVSIWDEMMASVRSLVRRAWAYGHGRGRQSAWSLSVRAGRQLRRNMVPRRLLSFPHLLVGLWIVVLLWGETWTFATQVNRCDWDHWEDWPPGATPHRLIFVADPQIIDPHSYPGRPWPLNPLTMRITDNYMRRSYTQLQTVLQPDTVMFLGDLFDGGREWKTAHGKFDDPVWAKDHRPSDEKKLLKKWNKKYREKYWLKEYARFGRIFFDNWIWGGTTPSPLQRGRKLISSLPGNHDLGFGAEVKLPVRNRFSAYFGETNRVDVIGNHTFVSVDTVSLSADTSNLIDRVDLSQIYQPVNDFLGEVKATKRRAVQKELRFWRGDVEEVILEHKVEDLDNADFRNLPTIDPGKDAPDFPTILLTHVPLYRDSGTPCGPMREHWPPTVPPNGQTGPVVPDHRNAISISSGYQYQNVLSDEDSIKLIKSIGNVIHVFSGDDHDYCEVVHSPEKENVREITVKSFSMAMGVPTPGFQMVSLYNPVDDQGQPLASSTGRTLQTHLCLLPNQLSMFLTYAMLGALSVLLLVARAFLVPILDLQPFALDSIHNAPSAVLPVFKAKNDADEEDDYSAFNRDSTSSATASNLPSARLPSTRTRAPSLSSSQQWQGQSRHISATTITTTTTTSYGTSTSKKHSKKMGNGKWGWAQQSKGPRIQIRRDDTYFDEKMASWRPASSYSSSSAFSRRRGKRTALAVVAAEMWTTCWRTAWMVLLFYAWLTWRG